ncbi:MAG: VWA domain-containing protein [Flavobacteriales bacterium]
MRRTIQCSITAGLLMFTLQTHRVIAQGVMIHDASSGGLLDLQEMKVSARIEDQVAIVTTMQRFANSTTGTLDVKYGYPLPAAASATKLRWMLADSIWHMASMVAAPQDTTLPGTGTGGAVPVDPALEQYLGETPLYFNVTNDIPPGEAVTMELTYVELLGYANARVQLVSANDYSMLSNDPIPNGVIDVTVRSQRAITGIDISGTGTWAPVVDAQFVSNDSAMIVVNDQNISPSCGFAIGYDLDPLAYGLVAMSVLVPDSLVKCDQLGNGFFALLIEPEPTSEVVVKDFVIVIDKSGSMQGTKIAEARDAAEFMVNHLNVGDQFNVIAFSSTNTPWSTGLQPFNAATQNAALAWIQNISAGGGTNINDAVSLGIQNFSTAQPGSAKSLILLTDGLDGVPTATTLANALQLRQSIAPDLQLFTFGIGSGYNEQLLNQLAVQNNGVSQFLETANFSQVMDEFYLQIQNPVLLSPTATFDRPDILHTYPSPLIGLFVGQQMVIVGRYDVAGPANLHLEGVASGQQVAFDYPIDLSGTFDEGKLFLPKIWAQQAIQELVNEYYTYDALSANAEMIRDSVVRYSMCYGIGSPFTSFTDPGSGGGGSIGLEEEEEALPGMLVFPDPSTATTPVTFDLASFNRGGRLTLRIFDALGHLVLEEDLSAYAGGTWIWQGADHNGDPVAGHLFFRISDEHTLKTGQLTRL